MDASPTPQSRPAPPVAADCASVAGAVLRLILYFDVFHHPLTVAELERLVCPGDRPTLEHALDDLEQSGRIESRGPFRFRPGMARTVHRRTERARCAERAWPDARRAANALARLPFVRAVLVTGGLSKGSSSPDDDVDFMLLVEPGRVWTLKTFLQGARRALPVPVRDLFCTNYLLATDRLPLDDQNIFTAIELATAIPMAGPEWCTALLSANSWSHRHVPGFGWSIDRARHAAPLAPSRVARAIESAWLGGPGDAVERRALTAWDRYWNRKYDWLPEQLRRQRFKRRAEISTNHLHDFQGYVLREVGQRFVEADLDPADIGAFPAAFRASDRS